MAKRRISILVCFGALALLCVAAQSPGERKSGTKKGSLSRSKAAKGDEEARPETTEPEQPAAVQPTTGQIVIRRRAVQLRSPDKYQVSMHLEPRQTVRIASPFDGTVKAVLRKPGQKVDSATEIVRMDVTEKQLLLERAKALYKAAQIEAEQASAKGSAGTGDASVAKQLGDARLQAAKADLDLAEFWLEQGTLRAPFAGEVFGVSVSDGQVVRMGDPLVLIGDTGALKVEIPVDRAATHVGQNVTIKVEDKSAEAKVEALLPLSARFEPLRDLLPSAAMASAVIQNSAGQLKPGQTVYSPLVPRDPIADVPNSCIGNLGDGNHKVQVLRENIVRDVPIATLAPIGVDRSFVSGPFRAGDEVIESTSQELADGTVVRPSLVPPAAKANGAEERRSASNQPGNEKPSRGGL
jgi:RND family efflux transporter MFP subunit